MNKHQPYNNIIENKLEQLNTADADHLWNEMHAILDKKMPQKKEKRRVIPWFLNNTGLVLLTIVAFLFIGSSIFFLVTNENSSAPTKELSATVKANKTNENDITSISGGLKENFEPKNESSQKITDNIVEAKPLSITVIDPAINNNFITKQTKTQSKKTDQEGKLIKEANSSQATQTISNTILNNNNIALFTLESINHTLVSSNSNIKKYNLKQQDAQIKNRNIKTNAEKDNSNERGLYTGFVSGLDLSSVRSQSAKSGTNKGFIIGYTLNKRLSIESGLLWDTKRVYDDGSNFTLPGYTPISGVKITEVNGKSRLFEIPLNVKYTVITGKHSLFATTGVSSYLMKSEKYDYEYTVNNQPGGHNYLSYTNETKNWLAVANFSIGYTHKLANIGSIRVEPYLKLPLKNIGIGDMPIKSTGLNIGFTKPLR